MKTTKTNAESAKATAPKNAPAKGAEKDDDVSAKDAQKNSTKKDKGTTKKK